MSFDVRRARCGRELALLDLTRSASVDDHHALITERLHVVPATVIRTVPTRCAIGAARRAPPMPQWLTGRVPPAKRLVPDVRVVRRRRRSSTTPGPVRRSHVATFNPARLRLERANHLTCRVEDLELTGPGAAASENVIRFCPRSRIARGG